MDNSMTYVDVDGHILEPSNMWKEYIEPEFRERTVEILLDEKGLEYLGVMERHPGSCEAAFSGTSPV